MIVVLTKPLLIGSKIRKRGTEIDVESNFGKTLIRERKARKPGIINQIKSKLNGDNR